MIDFFVPELGAEAFELRAVVAETIGFCVRGSLCRFEVSIAAGPAAGTTLESLRMPPLELTTTLEVLSVLGGVVGPSSGMPVAAPGIVSIRERVDATGKRALDIEDIAPGGSTCRWPAGELALSARPADAS
jgi:hypothetical protein